MVVEATIAAGRQDADLAAAASASEQAGKKGDRPVGEMQPPGPALPRIGRVGAEDGGDFPLPCPRRLPQIIVHDLEVRHLGPDPLAFRVGTGYALAGRRVFDEPLPVPDQHPGIEFVVENAGAARDMAPDAGVAPGPSQRAGNPLLVQFDRDGLRTPAGDEGAEDAPDGRGFLRDDLSITPDRLAVGVQLLHHPIAVAEAPACLALLHPAAQAPMGLHGEVFQEQGIHRALEADMKLADLPFGQGDDLHAREAQMLEQSGDIRLIAGDAVQRLTQHHIESAPLSILQERLDTRPQDHARPGDGGIMIGAGDLPSLPPGMFPAKPELILDRAFALVVGRIAGIERDAGHERSPSV